MPTALPFILACLALHLPSAPAAPAPQDSAARDEARRPPPDPELVERTTKELRKQFLSGEPAELLAAIERAGAVPHEEVATQLAKGLRRDEREVRLAALRALGAMEHPEAREVLQSVYRRDVELRAEPPLYAGLLRAIARHGSPESVGLLIDFSLRRVTPEVLRARILGLGRVRDRAAVAGLFAMLAKLGPDGARPYLEDFHTALVVLAGEGVGGAPDAWWRWWSARRGELEIAPASPELPEGPRAAWQRYWERAASGDGGDPGPSDR